MLKKLMVATAVVAAVAFAGVAHASECPLLVKQLNAEIAKMSDKAKAEEAKKMVAEVQKLHDTGKHKESVAKADETAKSLGVTLKHKGK